MSQKFRDAACAAIYVAEYASSRSSAVGYHEAPFRRYDSQSLEDCINENSTKGSLVLNGIEIHFEKLDTSWKFDARPIKCLSFLRYIQNSFHAHKIKRFWKKSEIVPTAFLDYDGCISNLGSYLTRGSIVIESAGKTELNWDSFEKVYINIHNRLFAHNYSKSFYNSFDSLIKKQQKYASMALVAGGVALTAISLLFPPASPLLQLITNMAITSLYVTGSEMLAMLPADVPIDTIGILPRLALYSSMGAIFNFTYPFGVMIADKLVGTAAVPMLRSSAQAAAVTLTSLPALGYMIAAQGKMLEAETAKSVSELKQGVDNFWDHFTNQGKRGLISVGTVALLSKILANYSIMLGAPPFVRVGLSQAGSFAANYLISGGLRHFSKGKYYDDFTNILLGTPEEPGIFQVYGKNIEKQILGQSNFGYDENIEIERLRKKYSFDADLIGHCFYWLFWGVIPTIKGNLHSDQDTLSYSITKPEEEINLAYNARGFAREVRKEFKCASIALYETYMRIKKDYPGINTDRLVPTIESIWS